MSSEIILSNKSIITGIYAAVISSHHSFKYKYPASIGHFTKDETPYMEIITGLLEWSYHKEDEFGIKMGAYAHFAINKKYGNSQSQEFRKSCR